MAASTRPLWRRAFDSAERAVGEPLERAVQTQAFADAVVASVTLQRALRELHERNTSAVLHLLNLPSRTDVDQVKRQVAALRSELREVAVRVDGAGE